MKRFIVATWLSWAAIACHAAVNLTADFPGIDITPPANTTPLTVGGYSLTGSSALPLLDLSGTWNTSGNPSALKLNVVNTASGASSLLMDLQVGGTSQFNVRKDGQINFWSGLITFLLNGGSQWQVNMGGTPRLALGDGVLSLAPNSSIAWGASDASSGAKVLVLVRDANDVLAMRNGANAQALRVYNTYTDASNYRRGGIGWSSSTLTLTTEGAGTGAGSSSIKIQPATSGDIIFAVSATDVWKVNGPNGHLLAVTDNTFDIGASGATRPRNIYAGSGVYCGVGQFFGDVARGVFQAQSSGVLTLLNAAFNDFNRLQFGGTSSGQPAIKRTAAGLATVLADDSGPTYLLGTQPLFAKTADYSVLAADSKTVFTNEGTTAKRNNTLPGAAAGLTYTFIVQDGDGLTVTAAAGDTIRIANSVTSAAGNIDSTTIGNSVTLVAVNTAEWIATSVVGTWTVSP